MSKPPQKAAPPAPNQQSGPPQKPPPSAPQGQLLQPYAPPQQPPNLYQEPKEEIRIPVPVSGPVVGGKKLPPVTISISNLFTSYTLLIFCIMNIHNQYIYISEHFFFSFLYISSISPPINSQAHC